MAGTPLELEWDNFQSVIPLSSEGTYDTALIIFPKILKVGSTYHCWYTGYNSLYESSIIHCTSTDGVNWSNFQRVLTAGAEGTYDASGTALLSVIYNGSTYYGWYLGNDGANDSIIHCISTDGINWSNFQFCFSEGAEGTYDASGIGNHAELLIGSTYHCWYTGLDFSDKYSIIHCTSTDGINWSNFQFCFSDSGIPNTQAQAYVGSVYHDGTDYHLWFDDGGNYDAELYAVSSDGVNFSDFSEEFNNENSMPLSVIFDATKFLTLFSTNSYDEIYYADALYDTSITPGILTYSGTADGYSDPLGVLDFSGTVDGLGATRIQAEGILDFVHHQPRQVQTEGVLEFVHHPPRLIQTSGTLEFVHHPPRQVQAEGTLEFSGTADGYSDPVGELTFSGTVDGKVGTLIQAEGELTFSGDVDFGCTIVPEGRLDFSGTVDVETPENTITGVLTYSGTADGSSVVNMATGGVLTYSGAVDLEVNQPILTGGILTFSGTLDMETPKADIVGVLSYSGTVDGVNLTQNMTITGTLTFGGSVTAYDPSADCSLPAFSATRWA